MCRVPPGGEVNLDNRSAGAPAWACDAAQLPRSNVRASRCALAYPFPPNTMSMPTSTAHASAHDSKSQIATHRETPDTATRALHQTVKITQGPPSYGGTKERGTHDADSERDGWQDDAPAYSPLDTRVKRIAIG